MIHTLNGSASGLTTLGNQFFTQDNMSLTSTEDGDQFGYSLAAGDFDFDGRDDLAIGSPFEDWGSAQDAGIVHVMYGVSWGLSTLGHQVYLQSDLGEPVEAGDRFGFSLATGNLRSESEPGLIFFPNIRADELIIGAPGEDFSYGGVNRVNAGKVHVMYGTKTIGLTTTGNQTFHQGHLSGTNPETNDWFGWTLATGNFDSAHGGADDLAIGSPFEDWSNNADSGVVHVMYSSHFSGLSTVGNQIFREGESSVADSTEAGDRFGLSLVSGDFNGDGHDDLAIGVPYEDTGATDSGAVQVLEGWNSPAGLRAVAAAWWYYQGKQGTWFPTGPDPVPTPPSPK